jgi:hypothetical protein
MLVLNKTIPFTLSGSVSVRTKTHKMLIKNSKMFRHSVKSKFGHVDTPTSFALQIEERGMIGNSLPCIENESKCLSM